MTEKFHSGEISKELLEKPFDELTVSDHFAVDRAKRVRDNGVARDRDYLRVDGYDGILNHTLISSWPAIICSEASDIVARNNSARNTTSALFDYVEDLGTYKELRKNDLGELQECFSQGRLFLKMKNVDGEPLVLYRQMPFGRHGTDEIVVKARSTERGRRAIEEFLSQFKDALKTIMLSRKNILMDANGSLLSSDRIRNVSWDELVLPPHIMNPLKQTANFIEYGEKYRRHGLPFRRNVLLSGPPGCGKSTSVSVLLNTTKAVKVLVSSESLHDLRRDQKSLSSIFRMAESLGEPVIMVFEDCESLLASRERVGGSFSLATFLAELDSCVTNYVQPIVCIMTSNRPEDIDPAAKRKSRLDVEIVIDLPDHDERVNLFKLFFGEKCICEADIESLAEQMNRANGADIREIANRSKLIALERDPDVEVLTVTEEDVITAGRFLADERENLIGFAAV